LKNDLLGNIIKVIGRASKNEVFNRIEFVPSMVFPNPNPEEELKRLEKVDDKPEKIKISDASDEPELPSIDDLDEELI